MEAQRVTAKLQQAPPCRMGWGCNRGPSAPLVNLRRNPRTIPSVQLLMQDQLPAWKRAFLGVYKMLYKCKLLYSDPAGSLQNSQINYTLLVTGDRPDLWGVAGCEKVLQKRWGYKERHNLCLCSGYTGLPALAHSSLLGALLQGVQVPRGTMALLKSA